MKVVVKKGSAEEEAFAQYPKIELNGLLKDGKFVPIHILNIKPGSKIFDSRFVD